MRKMEELEWRLRVKWDFLTNTVWWCGLDSPESGFDLWPRLRNFGFQYSNHHLIKETLYSSSANQPHQWRHSLHWQTVHIRNNTYCKQMYSTLQNKICSIFPTEIKKIRRVTWQNCYQFSSDILKKKKKTPYISMSKHKWQKA